MWFRIELDKTGAILSCEQVDQGFNGTRYVRFIEAETKAEACSSAKSWWQQQLQKMRDAHERKRRARMAAGKCSECDAAPVQGRRLCPLHAQATRDATARRQERRLAGDMADRRFGERTPEERLRHARERSVKVTRILREFDRRGPAAFRAWLISLGAVETQPLAEAAE